MRLRDIQVIAIFAIGIVACAEDPQAPDDPVQRDLARRAKLASFDPRKYTSHCVDAADCVLVPSIGMCSTCCGIASVRADDDAASRDLETTRASCERDNQGIARCMMSCGSEPVPRCIEGRCQPCKTSECVESGIVVQIEFSKRGRYELEAVTDGVVDAICELDWPPGVEYPSRITGSCMTALSKDGFFLVQSLTSTTVTSLSLRVRHDGAEIHQKHLVPNYVSTPGPNGEHCSPKECTVARVLIDLAN